jgi:hypothetical protein
VRPTSEDDANARHLWVWAPARDPIPDDERVAESYHHDHDEELGTYWYDNPAKALLERPRPKHGDLAYWLETGSLVRDYLILQAGATYSETLREGFVVWLQRSPAERRRYVDGDDMVRAALVDWYLNHRPE